MTLSLLQRFRFSPWFTQLVVIRRCNLSCAYCNEFDQVSDPVDLETLKERARKIKELGSFSINLTGGGTHHAPWTPRAHSLLSS